MGNNCLMIQNPIPNVSMMRVEVRREMPIFALNT